MSKQLGHLEPLETSLTHKDPILVMMTRLENI